jgi:hypothetical protein
MALENNFKFNTALALVTAGIQSGSIKLLGPQAGAHAVQNGRNDAVYLKHLLEELVEVLPPATNSR